MFNPIEKAIDAHYYKGLLVGGAFGAFFTKGDLRSRIIGVGVGGVMAATAMFVIKASIMK